MMSKFYVFIFISILISILPQVASQEFSLWSEEVDALIELDERELVIEDYDKAKLKVHRIIHVYNEKGDKHGHVKLWEDEFRKCKKLGGSLLSIDGDVLKEIDDDDISKSQLSPGYALYNDTQYQWIDLKWNQYPYKIEYEYELDYETLFYWPDWYPQKDIPVLKSTYRLIIEKEHIDYRTYFIGMEVTPKIIKDGKTREMLWELSNISPKIEEDFMPPENEIQMALKFEPIRFTMNSYIAKFDSWDGVARWYSELAKERYELPPQFKTTVHQIVSDASSEYEKISRLFSFLQKNTRYVAIHLGIGGWQPHSAEAVSKNKYGDCKDLSTLMIAMLQEAGIDAYPALTLTRDKGVIIKDFPSQDFNHLITFVPLQEDTLWLECTSNLVEAGELPSSVEGCDVLVVNQSEAEIIRTPQSRASNNLWQSHVNARLTSAGLLFMKGKINLDGNQGLHARANLAYRKSEQKKNWLRNLLGRNMPQLDLERFETHNVRQDYVKPVTLEFEGKVSNFAISSARRLFLNPNILNQISRNSIPKEEERHFPIYRNYPYLDIDSVEIELPLGFSLEAVPPDQDIQTSFGTYKTDYV
nr:DUF3857 and transglutaminase domain-containing protein [Nitrosopumilaceae archaeon]NIX62224.1 DUF3857 domain-containing protein [Nitrosopumilaceae archaeon]